MENSFFKILGGIEGNTGIWALVPAYRHLTGASWITYAHLATVSSMKSWIAHWEPCSMHPASPRKLFHREHWRLSSVFVCETILSLCHHQTTNSHQHKTLPSNFSSWVHHAAPSNAVFRETREQSTRVIWTNSKECHEVQESLQKPARLPHQ